MNNYAFIDSQNLNLGVLDQGWKLDFKKFRVFLKDRYKVNKAYLFIGYIPSNKNLYSILKDFGYEVVFKPTVVNDEKAVKGNVDAELVLHTMIEYKNFNKAIIISGDGDFYCLVEYLKFQNKLEKLIVPGPKYSSLLRKFSQYIVNINSWKEKLKRQ